MESHSIVEQLSVKQKQQLLDLLRSTWWATDRSMEDVETSLKSCMSFALIENETQNLVGYARVLTDEIKYAFIFDVVVIEPLRGKGFGGVIMKEILAHPKLEKIKNFELTCMPELTGYYEKFGFRENYGNTRPMRYSKVKA